MNLLISTESIVIQLFESDIVIKYFPGDKSFIEFKVSPVLHK